jgi:enoyl-CoA hydratase/carnithine racemase
MDTPIDYTQDEHVVTVTLNHPETRNAFTDLHVIDAFVAAIERMQADFTVRVGILTGAGTTFSSGGNLKQMAMRNAGLVDDLPAKTRLNYQAGIQRVPRALAKLEVPIIAAVNGPAIGAGCDLACMCDIRIASERARFAESFVKVGIIPGDGGAWFLPRAVGFSKACEMAFTGDPIDASEALACGLVSRVVPPGELMQAARDLAQRIAVNPPYAVRMTKRLMREGQRQGLDSLLELSAAMQSLAHATEDHKEAVAAFLAKRQPRFKGR